MYGIYDTKNNEQCVAVFDTRKEVAEYFNTTSNTIGTCITKKYKREHRYLTEKIGGLNK